MAAARRPTAWRARIFEFPLIGRPNECSASPALRGRFRFSWEKAVPGPAKLNCPPGTIKPLREEVQSTFESSRNRCVRRRMAATGSEPRVHLAEILPIDPFYERHGERQVERGHYRPRTIRRAEHLLPLAQYLDRRSTEVRR